MCLPRSTAARQYSLDVHLPGMLYGVIQRTPVEGATPIKIDDAAARTIKGVVRIVPLPFGVGVIAEKPWIAAQAREALKITWDRSAKGWGFDSEKGLEDYARQARDLTIAGKPWGRAGDPLRGDEKGFYGDRAGVSLRLCISRAVRGTVEVRCRR